MEKVSKTIKTIVITLLVILLTIIAFWGVYTKQNNIWKNIIPEFNYGIELSGIRELRYVLDTAEEEKNVYIDSEGNVLGTVKEEEKESEGISLEPTNTEIEESTEEVSKNEEENKPNYATEIRTIKANEDSV